MRACVSTCCGPLRRQKNLQPVCSLVDIQNHSAFPWHKPLIQDCCSESEHGLRVHSMQNNDSQQHWKASVQMCLRRMCSQTFAHSVSVSLQLTVFHAWDEVKQSKNLLLREPSPCWHHQAPCEVTRAVVHQLVATWVSCRGKRNTRVNNRTEATAARRSQTYEYVSLFYSQETEKSSHP